MAQTAMHQFWGANSVNRRSGRKKRGAAAAAATSEATTLLRELSGNALSEAACVKLLAEFGGEVEQAANAFFQMSPSVIEALNADPNGDDNDSDSSDCEIYLPPQVVAVPEALQWIELQLESLGVYAKAQSLPEGHEEQALAKESSFRSASYLSSSPTAEVSAAGSDSQPSVCIDVETVMAVIKREKSEMAAGGGGGGGGGALASRSELKVAPLLSELKTLSQGSGANAGRVAPQRLKKYVAPAPGADAGEAPASATAASEMIPSPQELFDAAKCEYPVVLKSGETWAVPPGFLRISKESVRNKLKVRLLPDAENPLPDSDRPLRHAAEVASSKVRGFVRYGAVPCLPFMVRSFEVLYPDTKVFLRSEGGNRHTFVVCGIAADLAVGWFSGNVVQSVGMDERVFQQTEGLDELASTVLEETGCTFFLCGAAADGECKLGLLGPESGHEEALALVATHEHVRECILRIPPTYTKLFDSVSAAFGSRLGCKLRVEGGGRIRIVGRADALAAAREVTDSLVKLVARDIQRNRLEGVSKGLMSAVLKVEVKLPLPEKVWGLLSAPPPGGAAAARRNLAKGDGMLKFQKRSAEDSLRRATLLWAALDALGDELRRLLVQEGVIASVDDLDVGSVALDVREGDVVRRPEEWSNASSEKESRVRLLELVTGEMPASEQSFTTAVVQKVEPGIQEGGQNFSMVASDWLLSTMDPSRPDPGRPSCDMLTVTWESGGKQHSQSMLCPGVNMLVREGAPRAASQVCDAVRRVLRLSYFQTVDELLLGDLTRAIVGMEADGTRRKHVVLERCRQRCADMHRAAEEELRGLRVELEALPCVKVREALLQHAEKLGPLWTQACRLAGWELETHIRRLRGVLEQEARAEKWRQTCLEAVQKISAQTDAFIDYDAPNTYITLSGAENSVRAAVERVHSVVAQGIKGLEETRSIDLSPDEVAQLSANNSFLLSIIRDDVGLLSAELDGSKLVLTGTPDGISQALVYFNKEGAPAAEEEEVVCQACLMETFGDEAEDNRMVQFLCSHRVHYGCAAKSMIASHSMDLEEGCTTQSPCRCPLKTCGHTLTPGEYATVLKGCTASRAKLPAALDNLQNIVAQQLHTQDNMRTCPSCDKWVIASRYSEPLCCLHCGHSFCGQRNPTCGGVAHHFTSCAQYITAKRAMVQDGAASTELVAAPQLPDNIVLCARCPAWILREDDQGDERCRYMKCRQCSYEFCWLCLRPSLDHRHYNAQNLTESVECDPSNRDSRQERLSRAHEVAVWQGYATCDRCHVSYEGGENPLYGCYQCLNHYLCHGCAEKGCTADRTHVVGVVQTEPAPNRANTEGVSCPKGHSLSPQQGLAVAMVCDKCSKTGEASGYLGCRLCGYDICKACSEATRSGGEMLGDPHLSEVTFPDGFWDRYSHLAQPEASVEEDTRSEMGEGFDEDEDDPTKPKRVLMNFVTGHLAAMPASLRAGMPGGGILAALLGLRR
eukprot:Rhum_TRINITY_DN14740_c11_g1::Rhum_TRINITY_DN14740_c11_g1_i1::g.114512::m.114512